jgi:4-amino-4-deoxy-L-arabinose transferase-like glycosyltransferase
MNNSLHTNYQVYTHYGIIAFVCFFSFFIHNQIIPADLMESRNLATAQEMVHYSNYLLPTMNGELRLEKPPLPTWIAAGIEHIMPDNLVAQRCASGFAAFLMVVFLYLIVSQLTRNQNVGLIASLILATCFNVIMMGRTATWDIYTQSFMLSTIYFLILALEEKSTQWKYFILTGFGAGFSFLSKGPVSFYALFLPFLISYIVVYRPSLKGKIIPVISMILICLVVSSWWVSYTYLFHKEELLGVMHKESSSWLNHNVRPWYYYWQFPAEAGIWALLWVTSIIYYFVNKHTLHQKEYRFSMIWLTISLILLSVIPEKKTRYLLPVLIPGSMVTGFYIYQMIRAMKSKGERIAFKINSTVIAVILAGLPVALYLIFYKEDQLSLSILIAAAICSWLLSMYIFISVFGKKVIRVENVFKAVILTMILITSLYLIPIGNMFINEDRHSIKHVRTRKEIQHLPFYYNASEPLRMELVYESAQRIKPLDTSSSEKIQQATPFVLISTQPIDSLMSDKNVSVEPIGIYDNNWRKTGHKRYNPSLVKEVAVIRSK